MARTFRKTPGSSEEYIASLDPLLRKKRPSNTFFGEDVNPFVFKAPGARPVDFVTPARGIETTPAPQTPAQEPLPSLPEQPVYPTPAEQGPAKEERASVSLMRQLREATKPKDTGQKTENNSLEWLEQPLPDGGRVYSDGTIRYDDGMIIDNNTQEIRYEPEMLGTVGDGYFLYRDGSIRHYDGQKSEFTGDARSLLYGDQAANVVQTQAFGNYNPALYGQGRHIGTDFGPIGHANLPISLPFDVEVVVPNNQGDWRYGNSVLVKIPTTGETFRFSHLQNPVGFRQGDTITANSTIGVTGTTGHSTGVHLDVEYRTQNGQLMGINDFVQNLTPDRQQQIGLSSEGYTNVKLEDLPEDKRPMAERALSAHLSPREDDGFVKKVYADNTPNVPVQNVPETPQSGQSANQAPQIPEVVQQAVSNVQPGRLPFAPVDFGISEAVGERLSTPGKVDDTRDFGVTEGLAKVGIESKPGKWNPDTPLGRVNVPDFGVTEKVGSALESIRSKGRDILSSIGKDLKSKTTPAPVYAAGSQDPIFEKTQTDVPTRYLPGLDKSPINFTPANQSIPGAGQSMPAQVAQASTPEPEGSILGAKDNRAAMAEAERAAQEAETARQEVETAQGQALGALKSPLKSRLEGMEAKGASLSTSNKYAKLYDRYKELKDKYRSQLDKRGMDKDSYAYKLALAKSLQPATKTGYANKAIDEAKQKEKAAKEKFYNMGFGDDMSYDDWLTKGSPSDAVAYAMRHAANINLPKDTYIPSSQAKHIERSLNVDNGSATLYTVPGPEPLNTRGMSGLFTQDYRSAYDTFKKKQDELYKINLPKPRGGYVNKRGKYISY